MRVLVLGGRADAGYWHASIPAAVRAVVDLAGDGAVVERLPESPAGYDEFDVVAFVSVVGEVLSAAERTALRSFVTGGGGFVGVHAAAVAETTWDWYGELIGARFAGHPPLQPARLVPAGWTFTDEWYRFTDLRPDNRLLLAVDEASYEPGEWTMPAPHPVAWCRTVGAGRSWYTSLGHTVEAWSDPIFRAHVASGLAWAGGSAG